MDGELGMLTHANMRACGWRIRTAVHCTVGRQNAAEDKIQTKRHTRNKPEKGKGDASKKATGAKQTNDHRVAHANTCSKFKPETAHRDADPASTFLSPDVTASPLLSSPKSSLLPPTAGRAGAGALAAADVSEVGAPNERD